MNKILCIMFCLLTSIYSLAQQIHVLDKISLQPIENASIYTPSQSKHLQTDKTGKADLSSFTDSVRILFQHPAYQVQTFSYSQLEAMEFKVLLTEKTYDLDEIVVSASKFEEKKSDIPGQIQVIKARDITFSNPQTSADLLQNTGNILVQKSQLGGGSPIIRGFEANKVLIVVDGVRMNNAIYRGGHLQNVITLDNSQLDRVEVVFGPGSVVYGSDALGGVMHFFTKAPLLASGSSKSLVQTNAFVRYATATQEKTGHADVNIGLKKWAFLSSFTFSDIDHLRQGNMRKARYGDWGKRTFEVRRINGQDQVIPSQDVNVQKPSGYSQVDLMQKALYKPNETISHSLNLQYSTSSDIPRYDRLALLGNSGNPRFAEWYYGPQKRLFASYTLQVQADKGIYNSARVIAAYQNIEESRMDRSFASNILDNRIENLNIFSLNIDLNRNIARHEIRYGLEATRNKVASRAFTQDIVSGERSSLDTRYPDGGSSMQTAAMYFTHTWEISPEVILTDGIRYSYSELEARFINKEFFPFPYDEINQQYDAFNGNLGIIFKPGSWRLSALASSGFRAPNVDDISKVFESVPGNVIIPNPDIKPEYTYNAEASLGKTFLKKVQLDATGYYTSYRNVITLQPAIFNGSETLFYDGQLSQVTSNVNAQQAYIYGFSSTLSAQLTSFLSLNSTLNYTYGRIRTDSTDYPLDHIPPLFGKTGLTIKIRQFRGEFFSLYNGWKQLKDYNKFGEDNLPNATPEGSPAWYTLNIRLAYHFSKVLQAQAAIENILDRNYRIFASGISAPGRNLIVTLRASF